MSIPLLLSAAREVDAPRAPTRNTHRISIASLLDAPPPLRLPPAAVPFPDAIFSPVSSASDGAFSASSSSSTASTGYAKSLPPAKPIAKHTRNPPPSRSLPLHIAHNYPSPAHALPPTSLTTGSTAMAALPGSPGRAPRRRWTSAEDAALEAAVAVHGPGRWNELALSFCGRNGRQVRLRWMNHLQPSVDKAAWRADEDVALMAAQGALGNRWSAIATRLTGRTDNSVKNRFKSLQRRRVREARAAAAAAAGRR